MVTQATTRRPARNRVARRLAGVVAAAAICLVAVPGTATAAPTNPSDTQLTQAQQAQADAAQQVGAIAAELAGAQADVDAARARSAIALDTFQGKQADYEAAQAAADAAAATAQQARNDLAAAQAAIASFARQSYVQGSTSPTLEALMTAEGPAQMVERAALLEAAGSHQGDVVVQVTAAEQQATAAAEAAADQHAVSSGSSAGPATTAGAGSSSAVETAIAAARDYLGTRYAWGGGSLSGPSVGWGIDAGIVGFDCSGLTRYAYAQAGITIPRNSSAQYQALAKVSRSDLQRGDLVFWATNTSSASTIHHVAIYLGNGQILEAPESGATVRITSMRWTGFIGGARPSA